MNLRNIGNRFQLNNYFIVTDKISDIFFLENYVFIFDCQMNFTLIRNACSNKLMFQSFLIYLLQETRSKFCMNLHHTTFNSI